MHSTRRGRRLAALMVLSALVTTGIALVAAPSASAQTGGNGQWAVGPVSDPSARPGFQYVVDPGQTITDQVAIANYTDAPMNFYVYAADAYNTAVAGAFAVKLPNQKQTEVGSWVQLPLQLVTVPGHQQASFPFTFAVPPNASPGDHAGAIVAQDTVPRENPSGAANVKVIAGAGARIYTRVRGPVHRGLDVTGATTKSSIGALSFINDDAKGSVEFQARNTGNVSLDAVARVKAVDTFGHTIKQFPRTRMGPLLPGAKVTIKEPTIGLPRAGLVTYKMTVTAQGAKASGEARQFIIPWLLVAILAALVVGFILWRWRRRRRRRRDSPLPTPPEAEPEPEPAGVR